MDSIELGQLIARLRRNQPRNVDLLALCDEAERMLIHVNSTASVNSTAVNKPARSDMAAYMRAYRAKKNA